MNALILAAGRGTRIAELTRGDPKSFLELGGRRIIEHQIDTVRAAHPTSIVVVTGYRAVYVESELAGDALTFVRNPFFDRSNVLGSVWFARQQLGEGFYFMHADTFFDPSIFFDLVDHPGDLVLCVESKQKTVDEEMKVRIEDGAVVDISKTMPNHMAQGEFTGLMKVSEALARRAVAIIEELVEEEGRVDDYFESVVQRLIDSGVPAEPLDIGDRVSIEIDFPEDYDAARAAFDRMSQGET